MAPPGKPRGILSPATGAEKFQLSLHAPSPDLAFFVEHYWIVSWDLRGQEPYLAETLPHPCVHLVIQKGQSRLVGVVRGKFSYLLEDTGRVVGVKFKPGAFYPFLKSPASAFTDRSIPFEEVFGAECAAWEQAILSREGKEEMIDLVEDLLRARRPDRDEAVAVINAVIDRVIADREITKVDDVAERLGLSKRTLQRLFSHYVGVSPKWVIQRYRLHEAAERLAVGEVVDWPALALDLGYFDQSHFIKDFKAIVGRAPADYARSARIGS
jgi:AraC-like DNA-binding protein